MKVLMNKVLLKIEDKKEQTKAGLFIPETANDDFKKADVIAVGDGTPEEQMRLSEGQKVLIGKYAGTKVEIDNEEYLVVEQKDVLVVL